MIGSQRKTKGDLLEHYADGRVVTFGQFDGFLNIEKHDAIMHPDADGDSLFAGCTNELRHCANDVRVFVLEGTSQADTLRLPKKMRRWIKRMDAACFAELCGKQEVDCDVPF
jgi:hypothetical protein